jgi:hypothetical protein
VRSFVLRLRLPLALAVWVLGGLLSVWPAHADETSDAEEIPVIGRPPDLPFSEASGSFEVSTRAKPTTVEAETPLTFTVLVQALTSAHHPPQRLDLDQLPAFAEQFYIEDPSDGSRHPTERTWEFVYRLKPRRTEVSEIPSLPFVFFNPNIRPASKGFQVIYTDPIPLHVLPHEVVPVPVQAPESAFVLATGPGLLVRQNDWTPPGTGTCGVLLLLPPILCAGWYACWRWRYPDTARQVRQRRSRAARQAIQRLSAARRLQPARCADVATAIVAGYLHERLDLAIAEPTPREISGLFQRYPFPPSLSQQAVHFFQACDEVRFRPAPSTDALKLPDSAMQLILAVEAESFASDPS